MTETVKITYDKNLDYIALKDRDNEILIHPQDLLNVLDECLLMRLYKIKQHKIAKMAQYINKNLDLAKRAERATNKFELQKLNTVKLILKEVRHAIKLTEMEENRIKTEMLERQGGE